MELGYLTPEGCLVVADSLGRRILFKAYRISEGESFAEVLGFRRPIERVANVTVEVSLHRNGWANPGEILLRSSPGRLYRSRMRHYVLGPDWRSVRRREWNLFPYLDRPWLGPRSVRTEARRPPGGTPFFVSFADGAVKGCRRTGATLEIFGIELKEFTDFLIGKLKATLRFETEAEAETFAGQFPAVVELGAIDEAIRVEIDRSRAYRRPPKPPLSQRGLRPLSKAGARRLLAWIFLFFLEAVTVAAARLPPVTLAAMPVTAAAGIGVVWNDHRRRHTVEQQDLEAKFSARVWDRFGSDVAVQAAGFLYMLRERGISLESSIVDLTPVDTLLRGLPPDTRFGAPLLGCGALVGQAFLQSLGLPVASRWVFSREHGIMVLEVRDAFWVSPIGWAGEVWATKPKESLQEILEEWVEKTRSLLAFRHHVSFVALGFTSGDDVPEKLIERVRQDAKSVTPESFVFGERSLQRRRVAYPPFCIDLVEEEVLARRGLRFLPLVAFPFVGGSPEVRGRLDATSPHVPNSDDIAVVHLSGQPMVPLGIQVRNVVEVGPEFGPSGEELTLRLLAVSDKVEVLTPRMREVNPSVKDFLAPMDPRGDGVPMNPYARFLGRVETVGETTNPFMQTPLWRLRVDISGFLLDVLVRKDRCPALPSAGAYISGNLWLAADIIPRGKPWPEYIR